MSFKIQYRSKISKPQNCWGKQTREVKHCVSWRRFSAHSCAALLSLGITLQDKEVLCCSWMRQELRALHSSETPPVSLTKRKQYFASVTILCVVSFFFNKWEVRRSGSGSSLHLKCKLCSLVSHEQLLQNLVLLWCKGTYKNFLNSPNSTQSRKIPIWLTKSMEIQLDCNSSASAKEAF